MNGRWRRKRIAAAVDLAGLLIADGRLAEAEPVCRFVAESDHPNAHAARRDLGLILTEFGRFDEAEQAFRAVVKSGDPEQSPSAAANLAQLLADMGRPGEAEEFFLFAMEAPNAQVAGVAAMGWGNVLRKQFGRMDEAAIAYRAAARNDHEAIRHAALTNLASLLGKHFAESEAALREVIASGHPDFVPMAMFNFGTHLKESGRLQEAASMLRRTLDTGHPEFAWLALENLGVVLRDLGQREAAIAAFRQLANRGNAGAMLALADELAKCGQVVEAIELCEQVAALDPSGGEISVGGIARGKLRSLREARGRTDV